MNNAPELKEYVFLIESKTQSISHFFNAWSQGIWATDPDDGYRKLASWEDRGFSVKFLHSMDEFKESQKNENDLNRRLKEMEAKNARHEHKIEVENV